MNCGTASANGAQAASELEAVLETARRAIINVGAGRGFLVETRHDDVLIITAAHCLPRFPPAHPLALTEERTFAALLGPLGRPRETPIWAECVFIDPVADVAVLAGPDNQSLFDEDDAFQAFIARTRNYSLRPRPWVRRRAAT